MGIETRCAVFNPLEMGRPQTHPGRGYTGISLFGAYRKRHHVRAAFRSIAFLCLVGGFLLFRKDGTDDRSYTEHQRATATDELLCDDLETADPTWLLVFYLLGILYMFLAIAIACDDFFVPALEEISSDRHLDLTTDVAGATLMAAGGSAPEFFSNMFGTFTDSAIGFGTIVGSAVFNVLFVIAMCALFSREELQLTWWPLFRDSSYYAVGLSVLAIFVGGTTPEEIVLWEAIVLFLLYLGYILLMYYNKDIYKSLTGKELVIVGDEEEVTDPAETAPEDGDGNHPPDRGLNVHMTGISQLSLASVAMPNLGSPGEFRPGLFRTGILKLLRDPESWVDTAGVGIVARIAGDAEYIFHHVDMNNDGFVDRQELEQLFQRLGCNLSTEELDEVFAILDENKDGKISAREFSNWYVRSEERILSKVKEVFDQFDIDRSGVLDRNKLKMLLETLAPRVEEEDIDEALGAMYQSGSHDEITYSEFADWYKGSLLYEKQKKAVEEDLEGVWESLKPPYGGSGLMWLKYLLVLPIAGALTSTIPDTTRPGMSKWCYVSFILSIGWVGAFSYWMVSFTEIVGHTIGVPSVVMGYTLLAAGTSVPDLLTSVIVARKGHGDMAVSSSIGSNIFDILVGLPVPWILYMAWPTKPDSVEIESKNILVSVLVLLGMLVIVIATIHCQGWRLTPTLAGMMLFFYLCFMVQGVVLELPFEACV